MYLFMGYIMFSRIQLIEILKLHTVSNYNYLPLDNTLIDSQYVKLFIFN